MSEAEEQFIPYHAEKRLGGKRALVFAPHPDDEVFGCAGAIMRHVQAGDKVQVIVVTDGGFPVKDSIDPSTYRKIRKQESIAAGLVLGYGCPVFWELPDRGIKYSEALVHRMLEAIFEMDADTVYAPSVYEAHPDHRVVAFSAIEAVRRCDEDTTLIMYEISVPLPPNKLLDITDLVNRKSKAINCFESQISIRDYGRQIQSLNVFRTYSLPEEVKAAEAYREFSRNELDEPSLTLQGISFDLPKAEDSEAEEPVSKPLVSIMIRSIGRAELRDALSSVALQFYPEIEVIIVNAKGRDHPPVSSVCGRYPVRFIDSDIPIRRSRAANIALDNAQGRYLMFLDDDDWIDADHISTLVEALEVRPPLGVAYSGVRSVGDRGDEPQMIFNEDFNSIRLLARNFIPIHAALFSRNLLDHGCRFDEAFDIYEDWDFWLQVSVHTPFHHVDKITANYRVAEGSGLGVKSEPETVRKAAIDLFQKWRSLWSEDQLCGLMNYIQKHEHHLTTAFENSDEKLAGNEQGKQKDAGDEPEGLLKLEGIEQHNSEGIVLDLGNSAREPAAAGSMENIVTSSGKEVQLQQYTMVGERTRLSALNRHYRDRMDSLMSRLQFKEKALAYAAKEIWELRDSRSWRVTSGCRAITTFYRGVNQSLSARLSRPQHYFSRGIWVLRNHGFGALISKLSQKYIARSPSSVVALEQYEDQNKPVDREVIFPVPDGPEISIVIPVFNKYRFTINCLESVQKNTDGRSYEVIVVDDHSSDKTTDMESRVRNIRVIHNQKNLGFVHSCNIGAKQAKGKYLVLLNNDTIVTSGWLEALVSSFRLYKNVGLVGAKLLYPDGKLQEAGGIVWNDASGWNYGRNEDPADPRYNYVRDVDYCSGACIAIERQVFIDAGMFDARYAPAYYEDTDLAFTVRKAGLRVLYQPACKIIHFEGVTSGTSVSEGVKKYQVVNQAVFREKWAKELGEQYANHPSKVESAKDRGIAGRMLVIDALTPTPDQDSGSLRMHSLLKIMRELTLKVTFIPDNLSWMETYTESLQLTGIETLYHPYVSSIEGYLKEHGSEFDIVWLSRANEAEKHIDNIRKYCKNAKIVFDTVDLHFLREERQAETEDKVLLRKMAQKRKAQELALMEKADTTLVVSPIEQEVLKKERPGLRVEIVSNIHAVKGCKNKYEDRQDIVFIGGFNHPPNVDAVKFFVSEIFPIVRQELEGIKFLIVGSNPPASIASLASDDIIVTGYVPDISYCFNQCRLSVAPLRYGAGVKGKINTSMSYGVPVVSTIVGAEGMFLEHGEDVMVGDDAQAFAQCIIDVYQNKELWERLSKNGMQNIDKYFSYEAARRSLAEIFQPSMEIIKRDKNKSAVSR